MSNMYQPSFSIRQTLVFNSFERVGTWWNYKEVISPFSRVYLITDGEGWVYLHNKEYHLTPGKLFLIPKFCFHSYRCDSSMGHYYFCFLDEIAEGAGLFDTFRFNWLVDAREGDMALMKRLMELNPHRQVPNANPANYDNKETVHSFAQRVERLSIPASLETQGIMMQLTSRFISNEMATTTTPDSTMKRLSCVTNYIEQHLNKKITLHDLAETICLSPDYFSKLFLEVMGIRPLEYVNRKRIERAQMLLITTSFSIREIAEKTGISNYSYFSTLFKKYSRVTPEEYRARSFESKG